MKERINGCKVDLEHCTLEEVYDIIHDAGEREEQAKHEKERALTEAMRRLGEMATGGTTELVIE